MRVISGTAKGIQLAQPASLKSRPISDSSKEFIFNKIGPIINGSTFLDLFAGTGSVGIEALSRGSITCTFVESNYSIFAKLQDNVSKCKLDGRAKIKCEDVFSFLNHSQFVYDIIFAGPPYHRDYYGRVIDALDSEFTLLSEGGLMIIQSEKFVSRRNNIRKYRLIEEHTKGDTLFSFFEKIDNPDQGL